jgi:hypothetical protein
MALFGELSGCRVPERPTRASPLDRTRSRAKRKKSRVDRNNGGALPSLWNGLPQRPNRLAQVAKPFERRSQVSRHRKAPADGAVELTSADWRTCDTCGGVADRCAQNGFWGEVIAEKNGRPRCAARGNFEVYVAEKSRLQRLRASPNAVRSPCGQENRCPCPFAGVPWASRIETVAPQVVYLGKIGLTKKSLNPASWARRQSRSCP